MTSAPFVSLPAPARRAGRAVRDGLLRRGVLVERLSEPDRRFLTDLVDDTVPLPPGTADALRPDHPRLRALRGGVRRRRPGGAHPLPLVGRPPRPVARPDPLPGRQRLHLALPRGSPDLRAQVPRVGAGRPPPRPRRPARPSRRGRRLRVLDLRLRRPAPALARPPRLGQRAALPRLGPGRAGRLGAPGARHRRRLRPPGPPLRGGLPRRHRLRLHRRHRHVDVRVRALPRPSGARARGPGRAADRRVVAGAGIVRPGLQHPQLVRVPARRHRLVARPAGPAGGAAPLPRAQRGRGLHQPGGRRRPARLPPGHRGRRLPPRPRRARLRRPRRPRRARRARPPHALHPGGADLPVVAVGDDRRSPLDRLRDRCRVRAVVRHGGAVVRRRPPEPGPRPPRGARRHRHRGRRRRAWPTWSEGRPR